MSTRFKIILVVLWIAMTAALVLLGYGSDSDAWRVARTADEIWETGRYVPSRTTGFPLHELLVTPAVHYGGWYLANTLSLLFGVALIAALFRLAGNGEFKHPVLVTISLAFLPIVVINASSTMDFVPALAVLIWAYVSLREKRWLLCAALIGIACGFRPTSGLFIIPAIIYALKEKEDGIAVFKMTALATVTGVIAYSPALFTQGVPNPFGGIDRGLRTTVLAGGYYWLQTLGIVQSIVIAGILMWNFRKTARQDRSYARSPHFAFHITVMVLWTLLFLMMPHESAYLLPAVPSLIFVIDRLTTQKTFAVLTILLVSFHIIQFDALAGESGNREIELSIRNGITIDDIEDRRFRLSTRRVVSNWTTDRPTVLFFGYPWIPAVNKRWALDAETGMYRRTDADIYISGPILDEMRLEALNADGFRLVVWRGAKWEYARSGLESWQQHVEVVDELSLFFDAPIEGRWKSDRR